jgi:hypothetical protein
MKSGIGTVDWDDIARAVEVDELDQTVSALARELSAAVRQLSLYGAAPLRSGSSASQGRLSCRWWVVLDPPVTWHCHYEANQKVLHSAQAPSLRLLFQGLAKVDGLQNPIAQAATLQCLVEFGPEVRRLPELAVSRLRSIPGWEESVRVIEGFQVATGLTPDSRLGDAIDDQGDEDDEWHDDQYDDYPDIPF